VTLAMTSSRDPHKAINYNPMTSLEVNTNELIPTESRNRGLNVSKLNDLAIFAEYRSVPVSWELMTQKAN
jgi:hypothetical protein